MGKLINEQGLAERQVLANGQLYANRQVLANGSRILDLPQHPSLCWMLGIQRFNYGKKQFSWIRQDVEIIYCLIFVGTSSR